MGNEGKDILVLTSRELEDILALVHHERRREWAYLAREGKEPDEEPRIHALEAIILKLERLKALS